MQSFINLCIYQQSPSHMLVIDPQSTATPQLHQYLLGSVAPRPIAFASTIDADGKANLAPYSFFNCYSSNPPILVFSSNRRVADNTTKDTLHNIEQNAEVVINVVNYAIVRQMALCSISYPSGVSEFEKSGLTPIAADLVKPFRVKESPVHIECRMQQIIPLGEEGGAGHLIICEVLRMHISEAVLDEKGRIDPHRIDLMGRMGRAFYVRASGDAIHRIFQPVTELGIGYQALPESIRSSDVLTANNLAQLASLTELPSKEAVDTLRQSDERLSALLAADDASVQLHRYAKKLLDEQDERILAMQVLML